MTYRESISRPVVLLPGAYGTTFDGICEQVRMQWTQTIEMEKQARRRELFEKKTLSEIFTLIQEIASGKKKEDVEKVTEEKLQAEIAKLNAKIMDAAKTGLSSNDPGPDGDEGSENKSNGSEGNWVQLGKTDQYILCNDLGIPIVDIPQFNEPVVLLTSFGTIGIQTVEIGFAVQGSKVGIFYSVGGGAGKDCAIGVSLEFVVSTSSNFSIYDVAGWSYTFNVGWNPVDVYFSFPVDGSYRSLGFGLSKGPVTFNWSANSMYTNWVLKP